MQFDLVPQFYNSGSSGGDEPEVATDPDSDCDATVGGKRSRQTDKRYVTLGTLNFQRALTVDLRTLKRTKTYKSFDDVRPTIRNKPSGLVNTWYDAATTPSPHQAAPQMDDYSPDKVTFQTSPRPPMDQSPPFPSRLSSSTSTRPPHVHWERAVSEMKPVIYLFSLYDTILNQPL